MPVMEVEGAHCDIQTNAKTIHVYQIHDVEKRDCGASPIEVLTAVSGLVILAIFPRGCCRQVCSAARRATSGFSAASSLLRTSIKS